MTTKFEQIKSAVEREKQNKIKNETRLEALKEEELRLKNEAKEVLGNEVTSLSDIESNLKELQADIESQIQEVANTLDKEGIEY